MTTPEENGSPPHDEDAVMADAQGDLTDTALKPEPAPSSPPADDALGAGNTTKDLEAMFDSDEDDEFASKQPSRKETTINPPPEAPAPSSSTETDPELINAFYSRLFPWKYLFQWLNHTPTPTTDFTHREFAFTLPNDVYLRFRSFADHVALKKEVLQLRPTRFEIGPVYSADPRDRKLLRASAFRPIEKELVFDIDLTDYDDIRTCCDKANICIKCWQFITVAIKILDVALREDFGFKHIMWVYSGRRGAHAWVCDRRARLMDDSKRKAIAGYLEVIKGGSQGGKKVQLWRPLHPHLTRSLDILKEHFGRDILQDQDPWKTGKRAEHLLSLLPDRTLVSSLRQKWESASNRPSQKKWADIDAVAKTISSRDFKPQQLLDAKQDVVFEYMYPRLDIKVSTSMKHLLKSPLVVHPGTGRVCVPIDVEKLEEFSPFEVPTVAELLGEIDAWNKGHSEEEREKTADWEKTGLRGYVEYFRRFVAGVMKEEMEVLRKEKLAKGEPEEVKMEDMEF